ncbi:MULTISPECIES: DUF1840 domain-containing protein [unclassified Uliginosibacterium]|uniref:DUF1840 domain-containing protein n=1 Tax=unclassified Uliginosibacterium TaxID=2621521 RepID=UPI000C7E1F97|nr:MULTISPECIES: DUF1840 domain-containing protein [unclassified Uliginosibacterium]MDO6386219.1 DUF1840 domain-containing protein [Uliginosibacterium sp. 31-12]PLK49285.1 DUF1840 domain-containing protein [Uliginosibacterium sp. TH139]
MLITFKSRADGDVIMFGNVGRQMLAILGKDPQDAKGIVTQEQLPAAIAALRTAIEQDKTDNPPPPEADNWGRDAVEQQVQREREQNVSFARRAAPLLTMLEYARRDNTHVTWES